MLLFSSKKKKKTINFNSTIGIRMILVEIDITNNVDILLCIGTSGVTIGYPWWLNVTSPGSRRGTKPSN